MRIIDPHGIIGDKNVLLLQFDRNNEYGGYGKFYLTKYKDEAVCGLRGEVIIELTDDKLPNEVIIPLVSVKIKKL